MASIPLGSSGGLGRGRGEGTGGRLCAILSVISIVLFTLGVRGVIPVGAIRSGISVVTQPVRVAGSTLLSPLTGVSNAIHNITASEATLTELEAENEQLRARVAELEEYQQTAVRLQDLLDLKSAYMLQSTAARV
ncbi:MAG: rod shape-determining protein MreC, partial [Atopobiaceae bacterium]|nr:rod shape-determining protein MreC [Atopobiaceae bacterium]